MQTISTGKNAFRRPTAPLFSSKSINFFIWNRLVSLSKRVTSCHPGTFSKYLVCQIRHDNDLDPRTHPIYLITLSSHTYPITGHVFINTINHARSSAP